MKTPRNLSAQDLIKILSNHGYQVTRQKGSHIRLIKTSHKGEHAITVPNHNPLKIGILSAIINDVTNYLEIDKENFFK